MDFASLHELLHSTYEEMMPLCAQMTGRGASSLHRWSGAVRVNS